MGLEMARQLRVLVALLKDLSSVPSTHIGQLTTVSEYHQLQDQSDTLCPPRAPAHMQYTPTSVTPVTSSAVDHEVLWFLLKSTLLQEQCLIIGQRLNNHQSACEVFTNPSYNWGYRNSRACSQFTHTQIWISYQDLSGPVWLLHCIICLTRFNPDISKSHKLPDCAANTKGDRLDTHYSTEVTQLLPSFSNWMHMQTISCLKTKECGCWRAASPAPTLLQNVWVRFPGPTWQLTPVCNSGSRRSDNLFQPWQAPCTPTQTETFSRGEG